MATKIAIEFTLTGIGFNPEEISAILGLQPTQTWRRGEKTGKTMLIQKFDGWMVSTGYQDLDETISVDIINQLQKMFFQIRPYSDKIKMLCKSLNLEVELCCVLYIKGDDRPAIFFNKDIIKWLADLNGEIDIDLYYLPDD